MNNDDELIKQMRELDCDEKTTADSFYRQYITLVTQHNAKKVREAIESCRRELWKPEISKGEPPVYSSDVDADEVIKAVDKALGVSDEER